jgi:hypothetical protein
VGFFVDRVAAGEVAWTGSSQPAHHGQGLEIAFLRPSARIVSADIVVHGYPATVHVIPATAQAPEEVTQAFHLAADGDQPLLQSSIWTQHIASIRWVELTRLDYADGTAWQSSAPRQCTAAPSLYRPVAAN